MDSSPIRVLHVVPSFHPAYVYGGTIETEAQLCSHLPGAGCEVRVLTTNANGPGVLDVATDREIEVFPDVRVRYCARRMATSVSPALVGALDERVRWADVVHLTAVYSFPTMPTLLAARLRNRGVVWSPHGSLQRWEGTRRPREKAIWERVALALAPKRLCLHTTALAEEREILARFPGLSARTIPNGTAVPEAEGNTPNRGVLRLLFLGRLDPKKGIERLLAACDLYRSGGNPPWTLAVAGWGEPEYEASLRALVGELGLADHVRFLGGVTGEARSRAYWDSDLVVVPSFTENFGQVVAEALAHGVPVIASRGMPWAEIETVGCGLWVENTPERLAEAISTMRGLPLRELGARGRAWMIREFGWESIARRMADLYREVA